MAANPKSPAIADLRAQLHVLAERLPDNATWADVEEYARFRAAVAEGKAAARNGDVASADEVRAAFLKWGVHAP